MARAPGRALPSRPDIAALDEGLPQGSEWHTMGTEDREAVVAAARSMSVREARERYFLTDERDVADDAYRVLAQEGLL